MLLGQEHSGWDRQRTRQVSPQVTCSSGSPWRIDALDVAEHEHVDSEELAEIEQVVSQAVTGANRSKGLVSDAQRDVW